MGIYLERLVFVGARGRNRTGTAVASRGILSPFHGGYHIIKSMTYEENNPKKQPFSNQRRHKSRHPCQRVLAPAHRVEKTACRSSTIELLCSIFLFNYNELQRRLSQIWSRVSLFRYLGVCYVYD